MSKTNNNAIRRRRGDVVWVELGQHPHSHIQSGRRPCIIVSTDRNKSDVYTVMPGTCNQDKDGFPVHVTIASNEVNGRLEKKTIFMAEQLVTVDEEHILLAVGHIEKKSDTMRRINKILIRQLELEEVLEAGDSH